MSASESDGAAEVQEQERQDFYPASDLLAGNCFAGRYEILGFIGAGGSGKIYKATDPLMQRTVAIKIIHKHLLDNQKSVDRFKQEGVASTKLLQENIARVYSQGVAEDGRPYLIMDYLEGESLADYLGRHGKLDLAEFFAIFRNILDALEYAHAAGYVHCDIKPSNIMLVNETEGRKAVLLDFGIAKCVGESGQDLTQTAAILGSSAYMSPEQCRGARDLDGRSDIYSLACVMLEALLGKSPFSGDTVFEVMYKHLNESLSQLGALKEMPADLSHILSRSLQKDVQERYQSIAELRRDFEACAQMQDTLKRRWQAKSRQLSVHRNYANLALIGALMLVTVLAIVYLRPVKEKTDLNALVGREKGIADLKKLKRLPLFLEDLESQMALLRSEGRSSVNFYLRWLKEHEGKDARPQDCRWAYYKLAFLYLGLNELDKAELWALKVMNSGQHAAPLPETIRVLRDIKMRSQSPRQVLDWLLNLPSKNGALFDNLEAVDARRTCLAELYLSLGEYDKSARLYDETLRFHEKNSEVDSWILNQYRLKMITALCKTGRKADAHKYADDCLLAAKLVPVPGEKKMAQVYHDVGDAFLAGDELKECISYMEKARDILNQIDKSDLMIYHLSNRIAWTYRDLGNVQKAYEIQRDNLSLATAWQEKASVLVNLSLEAASLGDNKKAEEYARQSLALCSQNIDGLSNSKKLLPENPTVSSVRRVCQILYAENQALKAELLQSEWINRLSGITNAVIPLSLLYAERAHSKLYQNKYPEALLDIDKSIDLLSSKELRLHYVKSLDELDNHIASRYWLKGLVLDMKGEYDKALDACLKGKVYVESMKKSANRLALNLSIGNNLRALGRLNELTMDELDEIESRWFDINKEWVIDSASQLLQLALLRADKGDLAGAERNCRQIIKGIARRYGVESRYLRPYYNTLAHVLIKQNRKKESEEILQLSLSISKRLGLNDPDAAETKRLLALVH